MPKIMIDAYEIEVKIIMQKSHWDRKRNGKITKERVADLIQQGIESPIDKISVNIKG